MSSRKPHHSASWWYHDTGGATGPWRKGAPCLARRWRGPAQRQSHRDLHQHVRSSTSTFAPADVEGAYENDRIPFWMIPLVLRSPELVVSAAAAVSGRDALSARAALDGEYALLGGGSRVDCRRSALSNRFGSWCYCCGRCCCCYNGGEGRAKWGGHGRLPLGKELRHTLRENSQRF